jgi:pseudouridine-5'-monophosphatase
MSTRSPPKVRACLFDMDGNVYLTALSDELGLLIDSERIYSQVTNEVLARYGKGPITPEVKASLMGRPGPKV